LHGCLGCRSHVIYVSMDNLSLWCADVALSGSPATLSDSATTSSPRSNADSEGSRPRWNGEGKQRHPQGSDEEYRKGHYRIQEIMPPKSDRLPIPESDIWFRPGDIVEGRVVWVNAYGAKVELLRDKRIVG
jgi:hypothetical protein